MTEIEAALAIIDEAKTLIEAELGGLGIQWKSENKGDKESKDIEEQAASSSQNESYLSINRTGINTSHNKSISIGFKKGSVQKKRRSLSRKSISPRGANVNQSLHKKSPTTNRDGSVIVSPPGKRIVSKTSTLHLVKNNSFVAEIQPGKRKTTDLVIEKINFYEADKIAPFQKKSSIDKSDDDFIVLDDNKSAEKEGKEPIVSNIFKAVQKEPKVNVSTRVNTVTTEDNICDKNKIVVKVDVHHKSVDLSDNQRNTASRRNNNTLQDLSENKQNAASLRHENNLQVLYENQQNAASRRNDNDFQVLSENQQNTELFRRKIDLSENQQNMELHRQDNIPHEECQIKDNNSPDSLHLHLSETPRPDKLRFDQMIPDTSLNLDDSLDLFNKDINTNCSPDPLDCNVMDSEMDTSVLLISPVHQPSDRRSSSANKTDSRCDIKDMTEKNQSDSKKPSANQIKASITETEKQDNISHIENNDQHHIDDEDFTDSFELNTQIAVMMGKNDTDDSKITPQIENNKLLSPPIYSEDLFGKDENSITETDVVDLENVHNFAKGDNYAKTAKGDKYRAPSNENKCEVLTNHKRHSLQKDNHNDNVLKPQKGNENIKQQSNPADKMDTNSQPLLDDSYDLLPQSNYGDRCGYYGEGVLEASGDFSDTSFQDLNIDGKLSRAALAKEKKSTGNDFQDHAADLQEALQIAMDMPDSFTCSLNVQPSHELGAVSTKLVSNNANTAMPPPAITNVYSKQHVTDVNEELDDSLTMSMMEKALDVNESLQKQDVVNAPTKGVLSTCTLTKKGDDRPTIAQALVNADLSNKQVKKSSNNQTKKSQKNVRNKMSPGTIDFLNSMCGSSCDSPGKKPAPRRSQRTPAKSKNIGSVSGNKLQEKGASSTCKSIIQKTTDKPSSSHGVVENNRKRNMPIVSENSRVPGTCEAVVPCKIIKNNKTVPASSGGNTKRKDVGDTNTSSGGVECIDVGDANTDSDFLPPTPPSSTNISSACLSPHLTFKKPTPVRGARGRITPSRGTNLIRGKGKVQNLRSPQLKNVNGCGASVISSTEVKSTNQDSE